MTKKSTRNKLKYISSGDRYKTGLICRCRSPTAISVDYFRHQLTCCLLCFCPLCPAAVGDDNGDDDDDTFGAAHVAHQRTLDAKRRPKTAIAGPQQMFFANVKRAPSRLSRSV